MKKMIFCIALILSSVFSITHIEKVEAVMPSYKATNMGSTMDDLTDVYISMDLYFDENENPVLQLLDAYIKYSAKEWYGAAICTSDGIEFEEYPKIRYDNPNYYIKSGDYYFFQTKILQEIGQLENIANQVNFC